MKESKLRDLIAQNLSKLKPGLTLLQKEQYIPGKHGTNSFIDLYARDTCGRHILIELKRSNAAARQAIHEVNKYIESVKDYFGAKDSEIHVIIASTEWSELLLPYSRFFADTGFSLEGIQINLINNETDFEVEEIEPLQITQGRFIAPWHNVYWYTNEESLNKGICSIEASYRQKGIEDYIIVKFFLPNQLTEDEHRSAMKKQISTMLNVDVSELSNALNFSLPVHEYIAYTALQTLSKETCLNIISQDADTFNEAQELLPDMEDEEAMCYLHECVESAQPSPKGDYYEIGYPAKFNNFFNAQNCFCQGIVRHGIFERNTVLDDDTIYAELMGEDGSTGQKFKRSLKMNNSAHIKNLKKDIATALKYNPVWRSHILRIIEEIETDFPDSEIEISIFSPSTGIFTIYYTMTKEQGLLYLPNYYIVVKNPDDVRMYFGALEATGMSMTFSQLLKKHYNGHIEELLLSMLWGGMEIRDSDIIEDLGAQYRSYKFTIEENNQISDFSSLRDEKWRPCDTTSPIELFDKYIDSNQSLIKQILLKIQPHDKGPFFDFSSVDTILEEYVDMDTARENQTYCSGAPDFCNICGCSLTEEKFMIDGALHNNSAWAYMCGDCFVAHGEKIGWGHGQLYQKDDKGWLLVGGFSKESDFE